MQINKILSVIFCFFLLQLLSSSCRDEYRCIYFDEDNDFGMAIEIRALSAGEAVIQCEKAENAVCQCTLINYYFLYDDVWEEGFFSINQIDK